MGEEERRVEGTFTHLVDLLLQMLQLRVLLVDEGELGEVALLHWRGGSGGTHRTGRERC